ncbi:hypothetical protein DRE_01832 [Drechslerella stenobrocha 248]|uniref:Uncharacterized protein n=1 Tax=Drechslerella stenobrocha 248 TaxID=1043628 RepID=W7IH88_9PEZI|nr:hypothetical protein DRE_01832 [Drechslerella stenobrocha 248]
MTNDASKPVDEATPAAHKAAREGNPQQLLEKLPAMLHGVMIQCADVFKNPTRQHPRAILHTNAVMRATIPATVDRFQQALDMLEIEILKAKAVLHRDLTRFHKAAELARQKELEEEERRAALEREAEAEATAAAVAAAAADLEMALDTHGQSGLQDDDDNVEDTDMDRLFEDVTDVGSLKMDGDMSAPPSAIDATSHPLEMSNIPLVAASTSKRTGVGTDDDDDVIASLTGATNDGSSAGVAAGVKLDGSGPGAATFDDPIILDSPLLPAADGDGDDNADDGNVPSAVDLFGDDPLNPAAENKDREAAVGGAGNMSIEEQIDMDFLFAPAGDGSGGGDGGSGGVGGGGDGVDDLFGDLDDDGTKLDIMSLDIPGLDVDDKKDGKKDPGATDIGALPDGASFDDLLASFGGAGLLENDGTLFDDAFDISSYS